MPRRSRFNNSVPMSLFSFQDIMTSVMGILIFITLMMATHLTRTVAVAVQRVESHDVTKPASTQAEPLEALQRREQAVRAEYEEALRAASAAAEDSADPTTDVITRRAKLEATQQRLRQLEARISEAKRELDRLSRPGDATREKLDQVVALEQQANHLERRLADRLSHPKLTYIVQAGQSKVPLLLELSGDAVGLGSTDDNDLAMWFAHADPAVRLNQLLDWLKTRDPEKEYIVVLLKPSAFGEAYHRVVSRLRDARYEVGTDILTEEARVLRRPNPR